MDLLGATMSWTYRVRKEDCCGEPWLTIVEYYDGGGWAPANSGSQTKKGLRWQLKAMLRALDEEPLELSDE